MFAKILTGILGVLVAIAGIYACMQPIATQVSLAGVFVIIMGISMVVGGIAEICNWNNNRKMGISDSWSLVGGIISIILGVILLGCNFAAAGLVTATFMSYMMAIWLVVGGIMRIMTSLKLRDFSKNLTTSYNPNSMRESVAQQEIKQISGSWGFVLVTGILMIIAGILCFSSPIVLIAFMGVTFGVSMIISGISIVGLAISAPSK